MRKQQGLWWWMIAIGVIGSLAGCEAKTKFHGYVPRASEIALLEAGVSNKASVVSTIGSPSFVNRFADNRWYYVAFETSQIGAQHPKIVRYEVLQLVFDQRNTLDSINLYNKEDLINVAIDHDFTPASGRVMTVTEQIIGNIGKFN